MAISVTIVPVTAYQQNCSILKFEEAERTRKATVAMCTV